MYLNYNSETFLRDTNIHTTQLSLGVVEDLITYLRIETAKEYPKSLKRHPKQQRAYLFSVLEDLCTYREDLLRQENLPVHKKYTL